MKKALVIAFVLVAHVAAAEPVVIAVDGPDIYVDLGAKDGVGAGAELELLHEVVVRDPRNGTTLRDHFSLGTISVVKSGEKISVARADDELKKRVLAGDRVKLVSAKKNFVDPWAEQVAASKPAAPEPVPASVPAAPSPTPATPGKPIDHAELAKKAFTETLGKPLDMRVQRWLELLREDPKTPYATAVQREIATLRNQIVARDEALAKARSANTVDRAPRIARLAAMLDGTTTSRLAVAPIAKAEPGKPIAMTFLVRDPSRITRAWLYVRAPGAPGFTRLDLAADGDAYLRATIPGESARAPGVQWYVEVQHGDSDPDPEVGSQTAPNTIGIEQAVEEAPIEENRSHIDTHVDYVDFDGGFGKGYDQYYQAEIDFTYRFLKPVYAVRLGFGTLGGRGGPKDVIDEDEQNACRDNTGAYRCKAVNFSYVYAEVEYRIRPNVAIMLRPQAGILTTDVMPSGGRNRCAGTANVEGCEFFTGFGGRVRMRLGDEAGTNLVLGAGFTDGVGTLLEAAYNWRALPVMPVQLSVQVTDQPVPENFGVRLIADVGWRKLTWFYPSLRFSYQARDIDHAGFSGGAAMNFDW